MFVRHFVKAGYGRALDIEAAAEKIIFFEEATGVDIDGKVYESLQEAQVSSYEVDTAPACDCSHAQPWTSSIINPRCACAQRGLYQTLCGLTTYV